MKTYLLSSLALLGLASCVVDPYGNPIAGGPYGQAPAYPGTPAGPHPGAQEQWRFQQRDAARESNQLSYERGISDGRADAQAQLSRSYARHYQSYTAPTQAAYQQGYDLGFQGAAGVGQSGGDVGAARPSLWGTRPALQAPVYPGASGAPSATDPSAPAIQDPAYQQGYDFGLRDRVSGRVNDPNAYVGRYDPRFRRSFEQGYSDAYHSR